MGLGEKMRWGDLHPKSEDNQTPNCFSVSRAAMAVCTVRQLVYAVPNMQSRQVRTYRTACRCIYSHDAGSWISKHQQSKKNYSHKKELGSLFSRASQTSFFSRNLLTKNHLKFLNRHNWWCRPGESHSCPKPDRRWVQLTVKTPLVSLPMWHVMKKTSSRVWKRDVESCWDRAKGAINTGKKAQWIQWRLTKKLARGFPSYKFQIDLPLPHLVSLEGWTPGPFIIVDTACLKNRWIDECRFWDQWTICLLGFSYWSSGEGEIPLFWGLIHPNKKVTLREIGGAKMRWSEFVVAKYFLMAAARGTTQDHQGINWENGGNLPDPHL